MIFVPYFIGERSRDHARLASGELVAPEPPAADAQQRLAVLYGELAAGVAATTRPRVRAGHCVATQAVFCQLVHRFPTLRLAVPLERLRMHRDLLISGFAELPVRW